MLSRWQLVGELCAVFLIAASLALGSAFSSGGQQASNLLFDQQAAWSAPAIDDRILLVTIDERSLERVGNWPWPRPVHAALIDRLSPARAIGYDVLFNEPTTLADDTALAGAIARSRRVTLPLYLLAPGANGRAYDLEGPLRALAQAARAVGHVNIEVDDDGLVRRVALMAGGQAHFTAALLRTIKADGPASRGDLAIPYNPAGAFPAVPAASVLAGEVPGALLEGRIVLVGATAAGLGDSQAVPGPAGSIMPGVEIQANVLNALLSGYRLRDLGPGTAALVAVAVLLALMLVFWQASPSAAFWVTIGTGVAVAVLSALSLAVWHVWLSPVPLAAGLVAAYPLWSWRRLSALNRYITRETRALAAEAEPGYTHTRSLAGFDAIALAASRLHSVIGELQDRRRFLSDVIESSPDALAVVDQGGIVRMANRTAKEILGEDVVGTASAELFMGLSPEASTGAEEFNLGEGKTYLLKAAPLAGAGDEHGARIIRLADITARRTAERDREEMLEFLSHDMRAPQAAIVNLAEGAREEPVSASLLRQISDNARFSLKLADDFVQLARLSAATPDLEAVDLAALAEEAADRAYAAAKAQSVSIEVMCPEAIPLVMADPWLVIRVLGNLLDNAVKFSPPGGTVTCMISQQVDTGACGHPITCSIVDQGPGIPAERQQSLFERFAPVDRTRGPSAGLGLVFVRKAIDAMGAAIECRTGPDGTTFELRFPAEVQPPLS